MLHFLLLLQLSSINIQVGRADIFLQTKQGKQFIATTKNRSNSGDDYQYEINECSLDKGNGQMVQYDIPIGGSIHMKCTGGCLNILKVLYACKKAPTKPSHLKAVQELCQGKEECDVEKTSLEKSPAKREPRLP